VNFSVCVQAVLTVVLHIKLRMVAAAETPVFVVMLGYAGLPAVLIPLVVSANGIVCLTQAVTRHM